MTMGLILLGVMMLGLFFSFGRSAFKGLGLSAWGAFLVVLAYAIGIIVPAIRFSDVFSMNVGGFIMPVIGMFALLAILVKKNAVLRGVAAMLAVTAATTGLLLVMPVNNMGMQVLTAFTIGLIGGALAFIIGRTRSASVFGILGGIALGDLIFCLIDYYAVTGAAFTLGRSVVYNSIFVAVIFALCLAEIAIRAGRAMGEAAVSRRKLNFEVSEEHSFDESVAEDNDYDSFDDELF